MNDFYRTQMGHRFYESTMPRIAAALERIAAALERRAGGEQERMIVEGQRRADDDARR